ncbi:MAG: glycogen/starch synthase [Candidatus Schekmanbacteria bacterium]|nr:glycogen/starch synthase [Candidatus Schekmanbacteria bacterium]
MVANHLRVALAAWEIGRPSSQLGAKVGGLGVVVEELPPELIRAAARLGVTIEVETLSPCFAHYDRSQLTPVRAPLPVTLDRHTFDFRAYEHTFTEQIATPDGPAEIALRMVYFWDPHQLGWTGPDAIYAHDPLLGFRLYAAVSQAMAEYIRGGEFNTIHLHDYHVGLIPFYLGADFLRDCPPHLTIHNASYQGTVPYGRHGYELLEAVALPGPPLFRRYFEFFGTLNLMRAAMLRVHEAGGKITTVSGDLDATWGYAAELRQNEWSLYARATAETGVYPGRVFIPNRGLDLFEKLPILGITNGMRERNRPEELPELSASHLMKVQRSRAGGQPLFNQITVQEEMLGRDHHYDARHLHEKANLKRLLMLECFGRELIGHPPLFAVVGRLVDQKNIGLVADCIEPVLRYAPDALFAILASSQGPGDSYGRAVEERFFAEAWRFPGNVYFNDEFNAPLSRLVLAGSDFALIPSRFEPCGLVDFEASLLGTVVIARRTGGLAKIARCGYLYDWLDISDWWGEVRALSGKMIEAIHNYRYAPELHGALMRAAMAIDAGWERSAEQYVQMYQYGLLAARWQQLKRTRQPQEVIAMLESDLDVFARYFRPAAAEYGDPADWALYAEMRRRGQASDNA